MVTFIIEFLAVGFQTNLMNCFVSKISKNLNFLNIKMLITVSWRLKVMSRKSFSPKTIINPQRKAAEPYFKKLEPGNFFWNWKLTEHEN